MKVNGTGAGQPPTDIEAASLDQAEASDATKASDGAQAAQASDAAAVSAQGAGRAPEMAQVVGDLSADLNAGRLSPEAAVDSLVQRILDRQLGSEAAPALRQQIETALRATLAEDPFVSAHVAALSRQR